jgi:hypothetical protein
MNPASLVKRHIGNWYKKNVFSLVRQKYKMLSTKAVKNETLHNILDIIIIFIRI